MADRKEIPEHPILKSCLVSALLTVVILPLPLPAKVVTGEESQTGLRTWEWREAGISLQLVQRLPDQTRAFFQGRGFSGKDADTIAGACVFQTIVRNDGMQPLAYDLDDWRITHQGRRMSLLTREYWEGIWRAGGVSEQARIALRWSLLPTRQIFQPGDYNWGMTSFGLPPGTSFDLLLVFTVDGRSFSGRIPGIVCTPDRI